MRLKLKFTMLFLMIVSATVLVNVKPSSSSPATTLRIDPPVVYAPALPDETFKVNLTVENVEFLFAWQANVSFDPSVIEYLNVTEGEFLKDQPGGTVPVGRFTHATDGWILIGWTSQGTYQGRSGSGILAAIEFGVLTEGESELDIMMEPIWTDIDGDGEVDDDELIYMTKLRTQSSTVDIPVWGWDYPDDVDSFFFNREIPPNAEFTYTPIAPGVNETVTFDATASSATTPHNITEYYWDFGDETNGTGQIVEHAFTTGGLYRVSLTVIDNATPTDRIKAAFNTTTMPRVWYELYSTKSIDIGVAFVHDIAVTFTDVSRDEVTAGETVSVNVTIRNNGLTAESFNVTAYYGDNAIETTPVIAMSNGTEQTLIFDWDTTGVSEGTYQISARVTDVEDDGNLGNNIFLDGTVMILAASQPLPTTLLVGAAVVIVVLIVVVFWFLRRRSSPTP